MVTALVLTTVGVACGSSADDAPAAGSADAAWSDTTSTLGVTSWARVPSDDDSTTITGYDAAHAVRSQFVIDRRQDAAGNATVRIRSVVQGPAVLEYRALPDQKIAILQDTFHDQPQAQRALSLAEANLKVRAAAADGVGAGCVAGAVGLAGTGCLLTGSACTKPPDMGGATFESLQINCSWLPISGASSTCSDDVEAVTSAPSANCKCVTPCAQQCQQRFNREYACPANDTTSCSNAAASDRAQEASCVSACGTGS